MKSRVALVAVLALGVFMSGTGASLAVSGFANTGSASSAQYPSSEKHKPHHIVEAANSSGNACAENGNSSGSGSGSNCTEPEVQAVEQVAVQSSSSSLPFTGFLAIPVLIVGLGLLGAGVVMRLRVRRGDHVA
jgi:hypothetical protein